MSQQLSTFSNEELTKMCIRLEKQNKNLQKKIDEILLSVGRLTANSICCTPSLYRCKIHSHKYNHENTSRHAREEHQKKLEKMAKEGKQTTKTFTRENYLQWTSDHEKGLIEEKTQKKQQEDKRYGDIVPPMNLDTGDIVTALSTLQKSNEVQRLHQEECTTIAVEDKKECEPLELMTIAELRDYCRTNNIKKFSGFKKKTELLEYIVNYTPPEDIVHEISQEHLDTLSVNIIKDIIKSKGMKNFSKYKKKQEMISFLLQHS